MTVADVELVDGSPGSGKTTFLRNQLEKLANAGLSATDFWWLNFTNSGRSDVKPEIEEIFPKSDEAKERAKTFHGLALSLGLAEGVIDDVNTQVIAQDMDNEGDPYEDFANREGLSYNPNAADPSTLLKPGETTEHTANQIYAISEYLSQTCKPPKKWKAAPINPPIPGQTVVNLLEAWDEFKREAYDMRRFEHSDYIQVAYKERLQPSVTVLLIDEFQDLAPAEYRLFKLWRDYGPVERIWIAGDPDQAIYSFRGATPYYIQNTDVDRVHRLNESYRCPREIAKVGNRILSAHSGTDPRGFDGRRAGGSVEWDAGRTKSGLRTGIFEAVESNGTKPSVMLLVRFRRQMLALMRDLNGMGVPYKLLGKRSGVWTGDMNLILGFLNMWKADADVYPVDFVEGVLDHLPNSKKRKARWVGDRTQDIQSRDAVASAFEGLESTTAIIQALQLEVWKREMLHAAVDAPAYLEPGHVQIGTIHSAKGLQAPVVYLFAESSRKQIDRYGLDPDTAAEEHRVYYVGATRPSESLRIVPDYFDAPLAPPLKRVMPRVKA